MAHERTIPPMMILCGGLGTRIRDVTESLPKPMVPIGTQPIVWHIMKTASAFGVRRFILCLGYKRECFIDYFLNYRARAGDITVRLGRRNSITYHGELPHEDWEITLADTGDLTMTGGRVARAARHLRPGDKRFFLTYGDGLADVDLRRLLRCHLREGKALTVTAVHPASRFGELKVADGRVMEFNEKPQADSGFINGGFMVVERGFVTRYLSPDAGLVLEQEPMRRAVHDGEMACYPHDGFWQCMDVGRDHVYLTKLWESGKAPWTRQW